MDAKSKKNVKKFISEIESFNLTISVNVEELSTVLNVLHNALSHDDKDPKIIPFVDNNSEEQN